MVTKAKRTANDTWDAEHMTYQTIKVRKSLLAEFKRTCAERGDKVNTVLRQAMENYIENAPDG